MKKRPRQFIEQVGKWATVTPNRPAVTDCMGTVTFGRLWEVGCSCADFLVQHGVKEGDAVGFLLPNCGLFVAALLGTSLIRAVAVLFPTSLSAAEVRRYGEIAGTRVALAGSAHRDLLLEAGGRPVAESYEGLEAFAFDAPGGQRLQQDDFIVQLTSGVDQPSKLAVRTDTAVWNEIQDFAEEIRLTERDTILVLPSIFHSYGLIGGTLAPLCLGGRVVLQDGFDPRVVPQVIRQERPTILFAVPVSYRRLLDTPRQESEDFSSLRVCFSAGAPLPQNVDDEFTARFGRRISQDYGSTEVGVITLRLAWSPELQFSVGRPVRNRTVTIVDPRGNLLGPDQVGEVVVRSTTLARAYLGAASGNTNIQGDRLITGDLGWVDADGYLFLSGRKSSLMHVGGIAIDPSQIEAIVAAIPGIKDVAVLGIPDHAGGERVMAIVTASGMSAEDILRHCRLRLAASHQPQVIEFRDHIPRTPAGKIIRRALRQEFSVASGH